MDFVPAASVTFPGESSAYRAARNALLQREIELRRQMEAIAAGLRALPPGGNVPEDYLFDCMHESGVPGTVRCQSCSEAATR